MEKMIVLIVQDNCFWKYTLDKNDWIEDPNSGMINPIISILPKKVITKNICRDGKSLDEFLENKEEKTKKNESVGSDFEVVATVVKTAESFLDDPKMYLRSRFFRPFRKEFAGRAYLVLKFEKVVEEKKKPNKFRRNFKYR